MKGSWDVLKLYVEYVVYVFDLSLENCCLFKWRRFIEIVDIDIFRLLKILYEYGLKFVFGLDFKFFWFIFGFYFYVWCSVEIKRIFVRFVNWFIIDCVLLIFSILSFSLL